MQTDTHQAPSSGHVRSALRALELLECFSPSRQELSLSDFARETNLPVTTTARLLSTLQTTGYLRKTESGRYACDTRLVRLSLAALHSLSIFDIAGPHLEALRDATGETANLAIPGPDGRPVYARQAESPRAVRHRVWLGESLPAAGTAMGEAMSGAVNADGYAVREGSLEPDVAAIAAPLYDANGRIVGGLSITMPLYRASKSKVRRYGRLVREHAVQASEALGWSRTTAGGLRRRVRCLR